MSKVIVLTGVTRGLGRALIAEFAAMGHRVFGCGTNSKILDELKGRFGGEHGFDVVDVRDDALVASWAQRVLREAGAPDLLINNAGLINGNAPLWEISAEEFDRVVGVNLSGVVNVIRRFVPAMITRKSGVIVNMSSGWGRSVSPDVAPYCATKWGIEGLSKALAEELPAGMACVPLNPGVINTEMLQSCFGSSAASCADPGEWARRAAPFILKLGRKDNGRSLSVGGFAG